MDLQLSTCPMDSEILATFQFTHYYFLSSNCKNDLLNFELLKPGSVIDKFA